jgi:glycine oxidase
MSSGGVLPDVLVIGGGVIGLSVAWRARRQGMSVTVLERERTGRGTSHVAAGMLAPVAEVEFGEAGRRVLELGLRSAELWPGFAAELEAAAGSRVGLLQSGTLLIARDDDEARELERQIAFRESLGLHARRLRPSEARELEPALAPAMRLALEAPADHSVDPRLVLGALRAACISAGVQLREHTPVARIESDATGRRVTGVTLDASATGSRSTSNAPGFLPAEQIVVAAGAWTGLLAGIPEHAQVPVRPVRGQLLRLRDPAGAGMLRRVVRFAGGYLVPRADGRYILGGTMEERGFDLQPQAGGVYELLRDAHELLPGVSELQIEELCVGLRPGTPDNAPAIGPGALEGLTWATGHHRNGILLAPLTADLVTRLLRGEAFDPLLSACAPARFTRDRADAPLQTASAPQVGLS